MLALASYHVYICPIQKKPANYYDSLGFFKSLITTIFQVLPSPRNPQKHRRSTPQKHPRNLQYVAVVSLSMVSCFSLEFLLPMATTSTHLLLLFSLARPHDAREVLRGGVAAPDDADACVRGAGDANRRGLTRGMLFGSVPTPPCRFIAAGCWGWW